MFSFGLVSCFPAFLIKFGGPARVVEWQTRTFEGRMPKGMRVQVPPRAPMKTLDVGRKWNRCGTDPLFRLRTEKYLLSSSNRIETDHDLRRASGREGNRQIQRERVSCKNLRRRYFAERSIPRRWDETMDTSVGIPWRNIPRSQTPGRGIAGHGLASPRQGLHQLRLCWKPDLDNQRRLRD